MRHLWGLLKGAAMSCEIPIWWVQYEVSIWVANMRCQYEVLIWDPIWEVPIWVADMSVKKLSCIAEEEIPQCIAPACSGADLSCRWNTNMRGPIWGTNMRCWYEGCRYVCQKFELPCCCWGTTMNSTVSMQIQIKMQMQMQMQIQIWRVQYEPPICVALLRRDRNAQLVPACEYKYKNKYKCKYKYKYEESNMRCRYVLPCRGGTTMHS